MNAIYWEKTEDGYYHAWVSGLKIAAVQGKTLEQAVGFLALHPPSWDCRLPDVIEYQQEPRR